MLIAAWPMQFSQFRRSFKAVLQLQLLIVLGRSTTILDANSEVAVEVEVLKYKPVDTCIL